MAKSKSATDMQFSNLFSQVDGRRQVDGGSTLRRKKPYLTDNIKLGREFRKHYVRGLKRLLRQGKLKLGGSVDFLKNTHQRHAWLEGLEATDWNVFIQGPPTIHAAMDAAHSAERFYAVSQLWRLPRQQAG